MTVSRHPFGRGAIYQVVWRADDEGKASVWLDGQAAPLLVGLIHRVETMPGTAGSDAQPLSNYGITLEDRLEADVLGGACANRSSTAAEAAYPYHALGTSGHGERATIRCLEFKVANAGAGGAGVAAFYLLEP